MEWHRMKCDACGNNHNGTMMDKWFFAWWEEYCHCGARWRYTGPNRCIMIVEEY